MLTRRLTLKAPKGPSWPVVEIMTGGVDGVGVHAGLVVVVHADL